MVLLQMYPVSRCRHANYCPECNTNAGAMKDSHLQLQDASGKTIDFMKLTCNRCGYTMLFDIDVVLSRPPDKNVNEEFPNWLNELIALRRAKK